MYREEKMRPAGPSAAVVPLPGSTRSGSKGLPRLSQLFARTWSAYLAGWGTMVRSGYAPPGTPLQVDRGAGAGDLLSGSGGR